MQFENGKFVLAVTEHRTGHVQGPLRSPAPVTAQVEAIDKHIAPGHDADFAIFAANDAYVVDVKKLKHKNPITPYDGRALSGVVRRTFLRGHELDGVTPTGKLLRRGEITVEQPAHV